MVQSELLKRMIKDLFPEVEGQNRPPTLIQPIWRTVWETRTACLREGVFRTTCDEQLISALPPESHTARVAFLVPKYVPPQKTACVVHLAGNTVYLLLCFNLNIITIVWDYVFYIIFCECLNRSLDDDILC